MSHWKGREQWKAKRPTFSLLGKVSAGFLFIGVTLAPAERTWPWPLPNIPSYMLYYSWPQSSSKLQDENHTADLWQHWEQVPENLGSCLVAFCSTSPSCRRQSVSQAVGDFSLSQIWSALTAQTLWFSFWSNSALEKWGKIFTAPA